ncbi:MAG TPA: lipoate--protein ligase [Clostridia bacterium]|nr:lipoate--protein ligase [Clostridia bacterium]
MIYIEHDSMDPSFWFGLERELLQSDTLADDVFLFWRTEPTLMLGRYQNATAEINEEYARHHGIHIVRRLSGGGTIYTDPGSWQFSFIRRGYSKQIDFKEFVLPVFDGLRHMGLDVVMSERNDLLIDGKKFSGNAQHHCKGRVLHHGSILFDTDIEEMVRCLTVDSEKIISKGISSVRQRVTNLKEHTSEAMDAPDFRDRLLRFLLPDGIKRQALGPSDILRIQNNHAPMFKSWDWVFGQSPAFQVVKSKRLPGGKVEICLNLEKGVIVDCSITGDFFFAGEIDTVTERLKGCQYSRPGIYAALSDVMREQPFYQIGLDELTTCIL